MDTQTATLIALAMLTGICAVFAILAALADWLDDLLYRPRRKREEIKIRDWRGR